MVATRSQGAAPAKCANRKQPVISIGKRPSRLPASAPNQLREKPTACALAAMPASAPKRKQLAPPIRGPCPPGVWPPPAAWVAAKNIERIQKSIVTSFVENFKDELKERPSTTTRSPDFCVLLKESKADMTAILTDASKFEAFFDSLGLLSRLPKRAASMRDFLMHEVRIACE
uniref:Uncharacterized protein n=1 Tax=Haptolina brevifila TaxID=156173 RepID=A0A7S2E246_9EUKA|mmetsp:Transcript_47306/g.94322  ORF Transcript_47306/g.94322 Transcript_47306/m.94322 type:complete len:173 (+) Transcript_47306:68-586(+)|eukprot:CAMPEP_0174732194 /NCGR_PEP_ID=MMETSP1094-20130205/58971_1 /TAXON_ID=156173 /ORGANISM="Chrysochromulina brevifilum, Strain UTEX LB 985" /LENGTH=172 /DNA_ID=CAMNT_0015934689 /DNA_START=67 /DNA_END=585 /DNA_ORIENTATION=-